MTYATAPEADAVALDIGETDFLSYDDKGSTLYADGAVSASAVVLVFDNLTTAAALVKNDLLQNGNELILVGAVTYDPGNITGSIAITRGAYGTTAAPIADNQVLTLKNMKKIAALNAATQDIVNYHKQLLAGGGLWFAGNTLFKTACAIQAIYISHIADARDTARFIDNISSGSYSDTVLTISSAAERNLDPTAQAQLDYALNLYGVSVGEYQRA